MDQTILCDKSMLSYVTTLIVCIYGSCLFGWWARRAGNPSVVFLYVMSVFIAEGFSVVVSIYARFNHLLTGASPYDQYIVNSWWWIGRRLPLTIVLLAFAIHMTIRVV
jgi:hypothetical protein